MKADLMFGINDTVEEQLETVLVELENLDSYQYHCEDEEDYIETVNELHRLDNLANELENLIAQ